MIALFDCLFVYFCLSLFNRHIVKYRLDWICKTWICRTRICKRWICKRWICKRWICKRWIWKTRICKTRICKRWFIIFCKNDSINDEMVYEMNQMNCGYEIKWSYDLRIYERNFYNCVEKPEKLRTSTGFEPVTSRFRCDALTNWAMKPLTLGAGHLWVLMVLWWMNQWWNGIWNESNELRIWNQVKLWSSQLWTQFLQLRREAWKTQDFNGVWTRDLAIPVRRSNQLSYEATDVGSWSFVGSNGPVMNESMMKWYMKWIKWTADMKSSEIAFIIARIIVSISGIFGILSCSKNKIPRAYI